MKSEETITLADRIGFAFVGLVIGVVGGILLVWVPIILLASHGPDSAGLALVVLIYLFEFWWVVVLALVVLGFLTADRYMDLVTDPVLKLFHWVVGHISRS